MVQVSAPAAAISVNKLSDEEIVERVRNGETALYEIIMRRYNARLYRIARGITGESTEAEDVMQEAYVRAYANLRQFEGRSQFATWLTKIAIHEALQRARRRNRFASLDAEGGPMLDTRQSQFPDPERQAGNEELRRSLENAIDTLPPLYRIVFVLREVEELNVAETAAALGITAQTVKVRLHRARALLRKQLYRRARVATPFEFHAERCDRVVAAVFARIIRG